MAEPKQTRTLFFLIFLLVILALGAAGYYFWQYQTLLKNPEKLGTQEVTKLVAEVGEIIELPTGEEPQLATVTDVEAVKKDQPFFANASNGDKVLIYKTAKKAFLYRPSAKKIIEVGPVTTDESAQVAPSVDATSSDASSADVAQPTVKSSTITPSPGE